MKYLLQAEEGLEKPLIYYLSLEEYAARHIEEDVFFLWRVAPTVICGRNQVLAAEVNLDFCRAHNINVFRRKSGGGAVYSDPGNIMISYIVSSEDVPFTFDAYLRKAALYLKSIGIDARPSGRNDLLVQGRKVSGNAFYKIGKKSIIHGTMLFDTDFEMMSAALTPSYSKICSKGIASVRQRVANISEFTTLSAGAFMKGLVDFFCDGQMRLPPDADSQVEKIMETYSEPVFIKGHEPVYSIENEALIDGVGTVRLCCIIKGGRLRELELKGDFFALCDDPGALVTKELEGVDFSAEAVGAALSDELPGRAVKGLKKKDLLALMFDGAGQRTC